MDEEQDGRETSSRRSQRSYREGSYQYVEVWEIHGSCGEEERLKRIMKRKRQRRSEEKRRKKKRRKGKGQETIE